MFVNFRKSLNDNNIFKTSNFINKKDSECFLLNKYCLQKCYCERNIDGNIKKYFIDSDIFNWELEVYSKLINKGVVSEFVIEHEISCLTYNVKDKMSMYNYLLQNKGYTKVILNELYSFVKKFNRYNFLHGNLHLHNIFVNPETFLSKGDLYVIDFSNSYLFETNRKGVTSFPRYNRTSFMGEYDKKINDEFFIYWDFFTLYVSLKMFLKADLENLVYLENLVQNYMSEDIIERYLSYIS